MNLNLEIEQGSQADNIGKSLEQSTANLGKVVISDVKLDTANVVASTGINIGNGSTDQIIADNISAAMNLAGEQGLSNLANNLENYTQNLAAIGLNSPEELVQVLLDTINEVLAENGAINAIQKGLQATTNTVELAKKGLNYATSGSTVVANLEKLMMKLDKMQDVDVTCVPSVKDNTLAISASLIDQLKSQYEALKQQLILFYNSMICASNDSVIDNMVMSINKQLTVIEPLLDKVLNEYTGHTVSEIRNICNQGFAYIGMIERSAANKQKVETENTEQIENNNK